MSTLAGQVVEQLKTDMDNVYDAGYQKGKSEGGVNLFQYTHSLARVFSYAVFDVDDLVVDCSNDLGNKIDNMEYAFIFTKGAKNIVIKANTTNANNMNGFSMYQAFYQSEFEKIDLSGVTPLTPNEINYCFYSKGKLKEIVGEFDLSYIKTDMGYYTFANSTLLEEIRIKKETIYKSIMFSQCYSLSDASIQSIIYGLANLAGQTTKTLTLHADVKAKLTEEQIATITSKNWTLA